MKVDTTIGADFWFILIHRGYFKTMFDCNFFWYTAYCAATIRDDLDEIIPASESMGCFI